MLRKRLKREPVSEADASGRTREIYGEIKDTLGVPFVDVFFQAYGAYPEFLDLLWTSIRPALQSQDFRALAERLRAEAYTRVHSYFAVPDFDWRRSELHLTGAAREELIEAAELFYYSDSILLTLCAVVCQAFERPVGRDVEAETQSNSHPIFHGQLLLIPESSAPPMTRRIYDDIMRTTGTAVINTSYCAFGKWPDFLAYYWSVLRPITSSAVYHESQFGVTDTAMVLAREIPAVIDLRQERMERAGISDQESRDIELMTRMFAKSLAALVLNVVIAKVGLEGGTAAGRRRTAGQFEKQVA